MLSPPADVYRDAVVVERTRTVLADLDSLASQWPRPPRNLARYVGEMPMPKRASVDDYFAQLSDVQRPHLEALRELCRNADPEVREELKWNLPVYVRGKNTNLWMLQNFKNHCSLRFSPAFFGTQKKAVEAAGYEAGEGFIKLPYDRPLPTKLLKQLMQARRKDFEQNGE